jgi:hypothetical protein
LALVKQVKPGAEVLVEGELSPFEHEALFQLLKKRFTVSEPSYVELPDENIVTRVTITFEHPYNSSFFTDVFQEGWRDLKGILKEIRHRRGGAGAAFNLVFLDEGTRLVFKLGLLAGEEMVSGIDQIGHLTGIVKRIAESWNMNEPLVRMECVFDGTSDRWQDYRGYVRSDKQVYRFEDASFTWRVDV